MSQPQVVYWDDATTSTQAIAIAQSGKENTPLQLTSGNNPYVFSNCIRSLSLTSSDDNSGVEFAVEGIGYTVDQDGNPNSVLGPISENLTGPNNDIVYSAKIYTQINSITPNGNTIGEVSVGIGPIGIINYIFPDTNRPYWGANVSVQASEDIEDLEYSVWASLNKPSYPGAFPEGGMIVPFNGGLLPATAIIDAGNGTEFAEINVPYATIWMSVYGTNLPTVPATGSLIFTFLQQGIS